jgi:spore maturation protein CgeB
MKFVMFYHSFSSCWNHGNAHFLRGLARELIRLRHEVTVYEPAHGWSKTNALGDGGADALAEAAALVPGVTIVPYVETSLDLDRALEGANVVLVHEWNSPELIAAIGRRRSNGGRFTLLFHDTHHRAITAPKEIEKFDIDGYDAVLAFGEVLREVYLDRGWTSRAFTWHEAADTALFRFIPHLEKDTDLVWIGNWGDDERSKDLHQFLIKPITRLGIAAAIHGVRYPAAVRKTLAEASIRYRGWLPNHRAPEVFARARVTVHVPRGPYVARLPGIPTIRVFEALACGIPLICSPWHDAEFLFPAGSYLTARNADEMTNAIGRVLKDAELAKELVRTGHQAVWRRHTCAHRVRELFRIVETLRGNSVNAPSELAHKQERIAAP